MQISVFSNRQNMATKAFFTICYPSLGRLFKLYFISNLHLKNFCLLSTRLKTITFVLQLIDQILPYFERSQRQGYTYIRLKQGSIKRAIIAIYHTEMVCLAR